VTFSFFANNSDVEIACVQASLSNGVTTQLAAIPWTTGTFAVLVILATGVAGGISYTATMPTGTSPNTMANGNVGSGHLGPPANHMDPTALFLHFQFISTTGLLSLKYPPIYQSFTANFAWANFIIPLSAFRRAAERMRTCDLDTSTSNDAWLSQFGVPDVSSKVTAAESTVGIAAYAAKLGLSQQDIFVIAYLVFICACAAILGIFVLVGLAVQIASFVISSPEKKELWLSRRTRWQQMSSNNSLRIVSDPSFLIYPCS
jgi:hypothetical protein